MNPLSAEPVIPALFISSYGEKTGIIPTHGGGRKAPQLTKQLDFGASTLNVEASLWVFWGER